MQTKTCALCKEPKPVTDFCKNKRNSDGLHSYCKECNILKSRAYAKSSKGQEYQARRAKEIRTRSATCPLTKTCCKCKEEKSASDFHKSSVNGDGLHSYCKMCNIANAKEYIKTDKAQECVRSYLESKKLQPGMQLPIVKTCSMCEIVKEAAEFYKNVMSSDGLHSYCKVCLRIISTYNYIMNKRKA